MLSPLNPLKNNPRELVADTHRWAMLQRAVHGTEGLRACDLELTMPRPSYTIDTMERLGAMYPDMRFRLIIGQDNWEIFDSWRAADTLRHRYPPIVYRRGEDAGPVEGADTLPEAPLLPVSSTEIRKAIAAGMPANDLLPPEVYNYIRQNNLYTE